jgi:hypothetical protein
VDDIRFTLGLRQRWIFAAGAALVCAGLLVDVVVDDVLPVGDVLMVLLLVLINVGLIRCHTVLTEAGVAERRWGRGRVVPWDRIVDVRAKTRLRIRMIWLVLADGDAIALPAPISSPLHRDREFDAKLAIVTGVWATHHKPLPEPALDADADADERTDAPDDGPPADAI